MAQTNGPGDGGEADADGPFVCAYVVGAPMHGLGWCLESAMSLSARGARRAVNSISFRNAGWLELPHPARRAQWPQSDFSARRRTVIEDSVLVRTVEEMGLPAGQITLLPCLFQPGLSSSQRANFWDNACSSEDGWMCGLSGKVGGEQGGSSIGAGHDSLVGSCDAQGSSLAAAWDSAGERSWQVMSWGGCRIGVCVWSVA